MKKKRKQKLTKTLSMALHSPGAPTHCTSFGDRGQAKEGKQWKQIKVELVFLMHMISIMPTDMDPFSVSTSWVLTCLQQKEGTKSEDSFSCSSLPTDFLQSPQSVSSSMAPSSGRWWWAWQSLWRYFAIFVSWRRSLFSHRILPVSRMAWKGSIALATIAL